MKIGNKQFDPKASFKFARVAEKKYKRDDNVSGVEQIYQGLMSYDINSLLSFWDCATSHYGKEQPSFDDIEQHLESEVEEQGDSKPLFKEAFKVMEESGFLKPTIEQFWENLDLLDKLAKDEKEREQNQVGKEMFINKRKALLKK